MEGAGVHLPYYCIVDEGYNHCWHFDKTHSQLTRILKWERTRGRCERRREGGPGENEKETQTDRPTGWQRPERRGRRERERKKESRWYRQRNEQVMEVKWEWEQERKRKEGRPERNQTWAQCNWGTSANEHVMAARWDFPGRSCCFPICSEERHSPTWGRVKASRWDCLRQMKQGVFWCHRVRTKAWFPVLPVTQRVLCSLPNSSRLFVVRAVNN